MVAFTQTIEIGFGRKQRREALRDTLRASAKRALLQEVRHELRGFYNGLIGDRVEVRDGREALKRDPKPALAAATEIGLLLIAIVHTELAGTRIAAFGAERP